MKKNLFRLQKMVKLGDSLSGKRALERKPKVWLNNIFLVPREEQKVTTFGDTEGSLKRLGVYHLCRSKKQGWNYSEKTCG